MYQLTGKEVIKIFKRVII